MVSTKYRVTASKSKIKHDVPHCTKSAIAKVCFYMLNGCTTKDNLPPTNLEFETETTARNSTFYNCCK